MRIVSRHCFAMGFVAAAMAGCNITADTERAAAIEAFSTVEQVFQHPRCANCHIEKDSPGAGWVHAQGVVRGPGGHGAPGLPCSTCHGDKNPPASFGSNAPPGAPHWGLPPPEQKMAWFELDAKALCEMIQDPTRNGGRDLAAVEKHVAEDQLVLWGWEPGGAREPVPIPHAEFVSMFRRWMAAGAPCPG
jgi:mono/diheme cytochrome c family protein